MPTDADGDVGAPASHAAELCDVLGTMLTLRVRGPTEPHNRP